MASYSSASDCVLTSTPTFTPQRNSTPSSRICSTRRQTRHFSSLKSGMPYISRPPGRSARSKSVTRCPARLSCCAAASPAGPLPTTATRLPVRTAGGSGTTQPSSKARSAIVISICLIATGSSLMPSTQAASQGAGQTRPVNSGKLFVACSRWLASCHCWRYTRSLKSGMMFPNGQPVWQKGTPQSMQRAPCFVSSSCGRIVRNSL